MVGAVDPDEEPSLEGVVASSVLCSEAIVATRTLVNVPDSSNCPRPDAAVGAGTPVRSWDRIWS